MNGVANNEYSDYINIIQDIKDSLSLAGSTFSDYRYASIRLKMSDTAKKQLEEFNELKYRIHADLDNLVSLVNLKNSLIQYSITKGNQKDNKNAEKISSMLIKANNLSKKAIPELIEQLHRDIDRARHLGSQTFFAIEDKLKAEIAKGEPNIEDSVKDVHETYHKFNNGINNVFHNWQAIKEFGTIDKMDPKLEQAEKEKLDVRGEISDAYKEKGDKVDELEKAVSDLTMALEKADDYPKKEEKEQIEKNLKTVKREFKPKEITITKEGLDKLKQSALLQENLRYIEKVLGEVHIYYTSSNKNVDKIQKLITEVEDLLDDAMKTEQQKTAELSEEHEKGAKGYEGIVFATDALNANKQVVEKNNEIQQTGVYADNAINEFYKILHDKLEEAKRNGATPQQLKELEEQIRDNFELSGSDFLYEAARAYHNKDFSELPKEYQDIKNVLENSSALKDALDRSVKSYNEIIAEAYANAERGSR